MKSRSFRFLAGLLFTTAFAFLALAYWEWTNPFPEPQSRVIQRWQPPEVSAVLAPGNQRANDSDAGDILARPLFSPERRPFAAQPKPVAETEPPAPPPDPTDVTPAPAPPSPPPELTLKGVMLDGNRQQALIISPDQPNGAWVAPGEMISGWTLVSVEKAAVKVSYQDQETTIQLYVDNSPNTLATEQPAQ